jgi:hypothetical protein
LAAVKFTACGSRLDGWTGGSSASAIGGLAGLTLGEVMGDPALGDGRVVRVEVDSDVSATDVVGREAGRSGAAERIEDGTAGATSRGDTRQWNVDWERREVAFPQGPRGEMPTRRRGSCRAGT